MGKSALLTLFMVLCLGMTAWPQTAVSQIPDIERQALIALYNATGGDNWFNKDNWRSADGTGFNAAGTECSWYGVTCTVTVGRLAVSEIGLSDNGLRGVLPSSLSNLSHLASLSLKGNRLTGEIPSSLGDLSNLEDLSLWGNRLSGGIPSSLGRLSRLVRLSLAGNQLTGEIPSSLGSLFELGLLNLGDNRLTPLVPRSVIELNIQNYRMVDVFSSVTLTLERMDDVMALADGLPAVRAVFSTAVYHVDEGDFHVSGGFISGFTTVTAGVEYHLVITPTSSPVVVRLAMDTEDYPRGYSAINPGHSISLAVQGKISAAERQALLDLYDATDGDNWGNNANWQNTDRSDFNGVGTECSWRGIICRVTTNRFTVSEVRLFSNELRGVLPSSLENLSHLTVLILSLSSRLRI